MALSFLLAKVIGIFMILMGLVLWIRQKQLQSAVKELSNNEALILLTGIINLIMGLLVVYSHNYWNTLWLSIISLVGWSMLLKGVFALFFPKAFKYMGHSLLKVKWIYPVAGLFFIVLGLYLVITVL